jgi:hypothetical protein
MKFLHRTTYGTNVLYEVVYLCIAHLLLNVNTGLYLSAYLKLRNLDLLPPDGTVTALNKEES